LVAGTLVEDVADGLDPAAVGGEVSEHRSHHVVVFLEGGNEERGRVLDNGSGRT
jgi:hypothetical protein